MRGRCGHPETLSSVLRHGSCFTSRSCQDVVLRPSRASRDAPSGSFHVGKLWKGAAGIAFRPCAVYLSPRCCLNQFDTRFTALSGNLGMWLLALAAALS